MEDGSHAMTDLVPAFRNWKNWKDLLEVGNVLGDLQMILPSSVDADSVPVKLAKEAAVVPPKKSDSQPELNLYPDP